MKLNSAKEVFGILETLPSFTPTLQSFHKELSCWKD